jgi:ergothioneine biosynthesis protein EgtB
MTPSADPRRLAGNALAQALRECRARTRALTEDLTDAQWQVPRLPGINPIAWELAHLAWFAEFWVLRGPHRIDSGGRVDAERPARHAGPDALLDSSRLPHDERWTAPLPTRAQVGAMLDAQLDACLAALPRTDGHGDSDSDDDRLYFHRLALLHEDMHGEALTWLRQTLGYAAPEGSALPRHASRAPVSVPGGELCIGWPADRPGFAFDNELPPRSVHLADFEIDAAPLTAEQFLRFVEAGGYDEPALWPGEAGRWRAQSTPSHPQRWRRSTEAGRLTGWEHHWFDRWLPLDPAQPVIHINAWEAEAYCRWAGRRLPSAAEWEHAAIGAAPAEPGRPGPGSMPNDARTLLWGHSVWEWTSDAFAPYPGFRPGPYREYSAPWFDTHRELRGGAFATHLRLHDPRYRNFFLPERTDLFTGFRTAAP